MPTEEAKVARHITDMLVSHLTSPQFIRDEAELKHVCAEAGFHPDTNAYTVLVVQVERWSRVFATDAQWLEVTRDHFFVLTNMLHELLSQKNLPIVAEKDYQMVCIVNLQQDWQGFRQEAKLRLREMMEVLETEFDIGVTISVSDQFQGLAQIPAAYNQAREVLWYNTFLEREQQITFYEDLCDENLPMIRSDLTVLDKELIANLQQADAAGVKYVLHEIIDREMLEIQPSVKILRVRLGSICCKILDALEEFRDIIGDKLYYQLNPAPRIVEARTLSELTGNMDEMFDIICKKQNVDVREQKPQWVDKMRVYIDEHYTDENLGLTEVSTIFGITPSYATRVFKQYTGRGIYETIQHVRLTAAKGLMRTDRTMKQIAQQVGYTSFLSMNRAFKKYEGTTPSQFRDQ